MDVFAVVRFPTTFHLGERRCKLFIYSILWLGEWSFREL